MRTEPFKETHDVNLDWLDEQEGRPKGESRRLRHAQASRAWPALAKQERAIEDKKEAQKAEIKLMEADKKQIIATAQAASRAAETGEEPRLVDCQEFVVGRSVITRRLDTGETVYDRPATKDELAEWDRLHPVTVPGGGGAITKAAKALKDHLAATGTTMSIVVPGDGHDASGIAGALDAAIARICITPRTESALLAALKKDVPSSSPVDRKAAVNRALAAGHLGEIPEGEKDAGKLRWAPDEADDEDDLPPWDAAEEPPPTH